MLSEERFELAIRRFDEANAEDPRRETFAGREHPKDCFTGSA